MGVSLVSSDNLLILNVSDNVRSLLASGFARDLSFGRDSNIANSHFSCLMCASQQGVRDLEPQVDAEAGIWSPSTGIIDTHGLMLAMVCAAHMFVF